MMPGHCTCFFAFFWLGGLGACSLLNFCILDLEVATQIVLETIFEILLVLNQEYF